MTNGYDEVWYNYKKTVKNLSKTNNRIEIIKETKLTVRKEKYKKLSPDKYYRIDLHGMNESQAFLKLESTFKFCIKRNILKILVITGKGYRVINDNVITKGIIRSEFEKWMRYSNISQFVENFSIASPADGGDGAFYVKLKKNLRF